MKKVKVKGLTNAEIEELSKKMNAPAVMVIGFGSEFNQKGTPHGEFSFNSVGIGEHMTADLLDFVSTIMRGGHGKKRVDVQISGGKGLPPQVKQKIIEDLKQKIENGELRLDTGGVFGIDLAKNDMADSLAFAMRATKDGMPLQISKHPQRTPLWKRVVQFFKRPKLTDSNLERSTFSNLRPPTDQEVEEIMKILSHGTKVQYAKEPAVELSTTLCLVCKTNVDKKDFEEHKIRHEVEKNICPVCGVEQKGNVIAHIRAKSMWESRKDLPERPYTKLMKLLHL